MNLVTFYRNEAADYRSRWLSELWAYSNEQLEQHHDFIQVLFPLAEESFYNAKAPVLEGAMIETFRGDRTIQQNLLRSLEVMLAFYGFTLDRENKLVAPADNFAARAENWLFPNDHNHLRITRILKCLMLCGLQDYARAFHAALVRVVRPSNVTAETLRFWENAVR
jgi:hypothetical protein